MVFEEKHHMPWTYEAHEAYEAYEPNFRENAVNAFHRLLLSPLRTPSTAAAVPLPRRGRSWGLRRSRSPALPSIAYRGFAVAPITLRAPSRNVVVITVQTDERSEYKKRARIARPPTFCKLSILLPQRPPSSREGDRPQAVEGVSMRWKEFTCGGASSQS